MNYITDDNKHITHVIVPIDEWNTILEQQGKTIEVNPYGTVITYLEQQLIAANGEVPPLFKIPLPATGEIFFAKLHTYNMLLNILQDQPMERKKTRSHELVFGGVTQQLQMLYPFGMPKTKTEATATAYILRNDNFYHALRNYRATESDGDRQTLVNFGFDITKFLQDANPKLLKTLYDGHQTDFISEAMPIITKYFRFKPIKQRIRQEPEVLRLFFFDIFTALDDVLIDEPSFKEIFDSYSLVDKLAKMIYPKNTLSGSTSRVYKATKEAKDIINDAWKNYVSIK